MKITIEETDPTLFPEHPKRKFSVEVNRDDLGIHEIGKLMAQCLEGMTWHPDTIKEIINYLEE